MVLSGCVFCHQFAGLWQVLLMTQDEEDVTMLAELAQAAESATKTQRELSEAPGAAGSNVGAAHEPENAENQGARVRVFRAHQSCIP